MPENNTNDLTAKGLMSLTAKPETVQWIIDNDELLLPKPGETQMDHHARILEIFAAQKLASTAERLKEANAKLELAQKVVDLFPSRCSQHPFTCHCLDDAVVDLRAALRAMEGSDGKSTER